MGGSASTPKPVIIKECPDIGDVVISFYGYDLRTPICVFAYSNRWGIQTPQNMECLHKLINERDTVKIRAITMKKKGSVFVPDFNNVFALKAIIEEQLKTISKPLEFMEVDRMFLDFALPDSRSQPELNLKARNDLKSEIHELCTMLNIFIKKVNASDEDDIGMREFAGVLEYYLLRKQKG